MADVRAHFASCIGQPPHADGALVTAYFSLKSDGEIFGKPRVVLLGYQGSDDDRRSIVSSILNSLGKCLPLQLSDDMARTIPGQVYFLQFRFGAQGKPKTEVKFRPYGSGSPLEGWQRQIWR
ncbi:MAG TPA: hypothetical protein VGH40_09215 [Roseiarcus sp.]